MKRDSRMWRGIKLAVPLYPGLVLVLCGAWAVLQVALPYLGLWMPRMVLDGIVSGMAREVFLLRVGILALALAAVSYAKHYAESVAVRGTGTTGIGRVFVLHLEKSMCMDYDLMEDEGFKAAEDKLSRALESNHSPALNIPRTLAELTANALGFLLYAGAIAAVHPLMLPVLGVTAAVNWFMLSRARRYDEETKEPRGKFFRRLHALREAMENPAAAKDLRMYRAGGWLAEAYRAEYESYLAAEGKVLKKTMQAKLADAAMLLLRDGLAYALLIGLVLAGRLTPGGFVFAFAAVGGLAGWISGTLTAAAELGKATSALCDVFDALTYPDRMNPGPGAPLPRGDALPPSVSLRGVGYAYPKAKSPALRGVTAEIKAGERIAIVGANGAGKTTLVKLLCGLCTPTEGELLINGVPISAYSRDEYYSLLAAVFQDIHLLAASVAVNVAQTTDYDPARVKACLAATGLALDLDALLVRAVHATALELSGGQKQKLAMARALYKNAPILLLDEPTAALDPIAEREVYEQYAALTEGKTSFYISHRLASTRFCDRILLIDGGVVAECGTHDELMRLGGRYAALFELQAGYYREGEAV